MSDTEAELLDRRKAMLARKRELKIEMKSLEKDLVALDHVLRMLNPSLSCLQPEAKPRRKLVGGLFGQGEVTNGILEALREFDRPATSIECASVLATSKGIPEGDIRLNEITSRVSAILNDLTRRGRVRRAGGNGEGRTNLWEIARKS